MTLLLQVLVWTLVLGLVHLGAAAIAKRFQEPPGWAAGSRDVAVPTYRGVAARLSRAQANLMETLPLFVGAVLACHAAGRERTLAEWGAMLYFWGRLAYLPIYAAGIPYVRTVVWIVATAGLCMVFWACLVTA